MRNTTIIFFLLAALVVYPYVVYPLLLAFLAAMRRSTPACGDAPKSVTVVIAALNEEVSIARRVREFLDLFERAGIAGELIVVSDGSTDGTATAARSEAARCAQRANCAVIELPSRNGKAAALSVGCDAARSDIIVFADARQKWGEDALLRLVEGFEDQTVGGVSGELVVTATPGVMDGVGLYWRYEKWIRRNESRYDSMAGATGAISAVRRELFRPIPPGTILDDVYWPLMVAAQGFRVVHHDAAVAYDTLPDRPLDEFRRKVRTLSGNFQLVRRLPWTLLPWRNPVWFQFVSHKLMRLVVPWALLGMIVLAPLMGRYGIFLLGLQLIFYSAGIIGLIWRSRSPVRVASVAASFILLNAAAWAAFWVWLFGQPARSWGKVKYAQPGGDKETRCPVHGDDGKISE